MSNDDMDIETLLSNTLQEEIWGELGREMGLPEDEIEKYSSFKEYEDNRIITELKRK